MKRGPNSVAYGPRGDFLSRFWNKVGKTPTCWNWLGKLTAKGYGTLTLRKSVGVAVHRIAYELHTRTMIPDDKVIDHLCRNRKCVNPEHLEVVTPGENTLRGESFGAVNHWKKFCAKGHLLEPLTKKRGERKRICRICSNDRIKKWKDAHREEVRRAGREYWHRRKSNDF